MQKRIMRLLAIFCLCTIVFINYDLNVLATEDSKVIGTEENIDYSYFVQLNPVYGYANVTRGVYLLSGDSGITKINSYTIGAGGDTVAAVRCDVSITSIVERYNMETDRWAFITSWTASKENAFSAAISKSLVVDSGYYYRVRSLHYAGTDASSSWTNALYVGN